jgi:diadenylate cyclase
MPDTKLLDKSLGSRHRAALGITEETDAVVVVVSEERGTISFCFNGNIVSNLDGASLRQALLGLFGKSARKKKGGAPASRRPSLGGPRISTVPTPGPTPSPLSAGNTGSVILPPVSNREGTRGDTPRPDAQRIDTPKARPIAAARIETPKPMQAVELPPPRDPPENT